jgi:hypothetical protein
MTVAGLAWVKWLPYWNKAFFAAEHHSIGRSILMGDAAIPPPPSLGAAIDYAIAYGNSIWKAMVLGLLLGSAVQALLPPHWIERVLGATGLRSVAAAGALSLPGMMCTCCAAPVVAGLRAARASPGAATAFWLGNTMLNPATLVFMGFVLGWNWSALRLVLGVVMVFGAGVIVDRWLARAEDGEVKAPSGNVAVPDVVAGSPFARWLRTLASMFVRLVPEYIVLVLLLGAARAWLFPHLDTGIGNEAIWVLAFALAGAIFVIPTAGEVPIVQSALALGVAAGPAAAMLCTLPPVSLPSLAMLVRSFPLRVLAAVFCWVVLIGIVAAAIAVALGF